MSTFLLGYAWGTAAAEPRVATGITEPINDVLLSAAVAGIVNKWAFKEGDFVEQDQVILELDKNLEELEVRRRELVVENRKADWEALKALLEKSSISVKKDDYEKAETDYKIAEVERDAAVEALRRRSVAAPGPGYIVQIMRRVGEACEPFQALIRLVDTRRCYFVSNIEAQAAEHLRLHQKVRLEIPQASGTARFEGEVTFLSPVIDPASGLQRVKVLFDNSQGRIRPGVAGTMYFE